MPYQFHCPQNHLLEAEPEQAGQQVQCPVCGTALVIPQPPGQTPEAPPEGSPFPGGQFNAPPMTQAPPAGGFAGIGAGTAPFNPGEITTPQLLHIPCPNGHELEVPPDMINQDVMCPHCNVQFRLRERDSKEYKRRKKEEMELKDLKAGKNWLMWAVIFAVCILAGLVALIGASTFSE